MHLDRQTQTAGVRMIKDTANLKNCADGLTLIVGRDASLRLTAQEAALLATETIQRMSRLRQTGLGYLAAPCSEHSRLAHCLGTTYWVSQIFRSLHANASALMQTGDDSQTTRLAEMDKRLGGAGATERIARLFALIHDCSLLPLGHTIKHQLGFNNPKTSAMNLLLECISRIRAACSAAVVSETKLRASVASALDDDLTFLEWTVAASQLISGKPASYIPESNQRARFLNALPALSFISEVVTGALSADIFDYAVRDLSAVNIAYEPAPSLLRSLCVADWSGNEKSNQAICRQLELAACPPLFRLGVDINRDKGIAEALHSLLEARYLIAEQVFFNKDKLAADTMLDVALRRIDAAHEEVSTFSGAFEPNRLLEMGDDTFLDLLRQLEGAVAAETGNLPVMPELGKRRLYATVCRIDSSALGKIDGGALSRTIQPDERNRIERMLREQLGDKNTSLHFSCTPANVQFKAADILIVKADGRLEVLEDIAAGVEDFHPIAKLRDRYASLWSAAILCPPAAEAALPVKAASLNFLVKYFAGNTARKNYDYKIHSPQ